MPLDHYRPLGRSGLLVSPLSLGTMTFGVARWGMARAEAETVVAFYSDAGGNVLDTADVCASGGCERMIGDILATRGTKPCRSPTPRTEGERRTVVTRTPASIRA